MSSWFSGWNPIVSFPAYHGPYDVGTVDVEIPATDLASPSETPERAAPTVAFRIFYPCKKPSSSETGRPVRWIPQPQRPTIEAFAKFVGVKSPRLATAISYMSQQLYWIKIPAYRNAKILKPPTSNERWPVAVFSHGLAGSRNVYSYVCGDLASKGMVVIALDHRDGSSPTQYVRATATTEAHIVEPVDINHKPSPEVYEGRDKQLRIRLWEISLAYEALMKIDAGQEVDNLDRNTSKKRKERVEVLRRFEGMLDIHRAGKVTWVGHSFGAATTVQLVKSIYYHHERPTGAGKPLLSPNADAAIAQQITPESPVLLLDTWCLPLQSPDQGFLWDRPLPSYYAGGPKGDNVLSVLSEAFFNWKGNLDLVKRVVAAPSPPLQPSGAPRLARDPGKLLPNWAKLREESPSRDSGYGSEPSQSPLPSLRRAASQTSGLTSPSEESAASTLNPISHGRLSRSEGPHMFFVQRSKHFNQSDFGVLFPWVAKKFTKAEEPERILELNNRAMVQIIREAGIEVAGESDPKILEKQSDIRRWISIPIDGESEVNNITA